MERKRKAKPKTAAKEEEASIPTTDADVEAAQAEYRRRLDALAAERRQSMRGSGRQAHRADPAPMPQFFLPGPATMGWPPSMPSESLAEAERTATAVSPSLFESLGEVIRLGIASISAGLAGSVKLMQGITEGGCHGAHGQSYQQCQPAHHGSPHKPSGSCDCQTSCCDCFGANSGCCNPGVHNCC